MRKRLQYVNLSLLVFIISLLLIVSVSSYIEVSFGGVNYSSWFDLGIIYGSGEPPKTYYVRVIYDPNCFEVGCGVGKQYRMWFGNSSGQVMLSESNDGIHWDPARAVYSTNPALGPKYHHVVIYDKNRFNEPDGPYYKIWFWNFPQLYSIAAIGYAESIDGIHWENVTTITQGTPKLVEGISSSTWNRGSYGPVEIIYNSSGSSTLDLTNPLNNRYIMYFDGTNGNEERIGLAVSTDGLNWVAYDGTGDGKADAVLDCSQPWEYSGARCYVGYASIVKDNNGYHIFYSGGDRVNQGIGLAHSNDGINWVKHSGNPLFHVSDVTNPPDYRSKRTYTPSVIYDGLFKMYYSAKSSSGDYAIGLAILISPITVTTTTTTTQTDTTTITKTKTKTKTKTMLETETEIVTLKTTKTLKEISITTQLVEKTVMRTTTLPVEVLLTTTDYLTATFTTTLTREATHYITEQVNRTVTLEKETSIQPFFTSPISSPEPLLFLNIALLPAFLHFFRTRLPLSKYPETHAPIRGRVRVTNHGLSFSKGMLGGRLYYLPRGSVLMWEKTTYTLEGKEYPATKLTTMQGDYWLIYPRGIPADHLEKMAGWF